MKISILLLLLTTLQSDSEESESKEECDSPQIKNLKVDLENLMWDEATTKVFGKMTIHHGDAIIFLGDQKSRKTTLLLALTRNLKYITFYKTQTSYQVSEDDVEDTFDVQQPLTSSTLLMPHFVADPKNSLIYYDFPPMYPNPTEKVEMSTKLLMKEITDNLRSVRLVFVVSEESLKLSGKKKYSEFTFLLNSIVSMTRNIEKFKNSTAMIVTNVKENDEAGERSKYDALQDVKTFLKKLKSKEKKTEISSRKSTKKSSSSNWRRFQHSLKTKSDRISRTVLNYDTTNLEEMKQKRIALINILLQDEKIDIFWAPLECETLTNSPKSSKDKKRILKLIQNNITPVAVKPQDFQYKLSPPLENKVHSYYENLDEKIKQLSSKLTENLKESHKQQIEATKKLSLVTEIVTRDEEAFKKIYDLNLNNFSPTEFGFFVRNATQQRNYDDRWAVEFVEELSNIERSMTFLASSSSTGAKYKTQTDKWVEPFKSWVSDNLSKRKQWYKFVKNLIGAVGTGTFQSKKVKAAEDYFYNLPLLKKHVEPYEITFPDATSHRQLSYLYEDDKKMYEEIIEEATRAPNIECGNTDNQVYKNRDYLTVQMIIRGSYVNISDFVKEGKIFCSPPDNPNATIHPNQLLIFATKKIYFDQSFSIQQLYNCYIEFAFVSPEVEALEGVNMSLSGLSGKARNELKEETTKEETGPTQSKRSVVRRKHIENSRNISLPQIEMDVHMIPWFVYLWCQSYHYKQPTAPTGNNGKGGTSGCPGGRVLGLAKRYEGDIKFLTNGGDGARGTDGEEGGEGDQGMQMDNKGYWKVVMYQCDVGVGGGSKLENITCYAGVPRKKDCPAGRKTCKDVLVRPFYYDVGWKEDDEYYVSWTLVYDTCYYSNYDRLIHCRIFGCLGGDGGDGGDGGQGGSGGMPGEVSIVILSKDNKHEAKGLRGENGAPGEGGAGGKGGLRGNGIDHDFGIGDHPENETWWAKKWWNRQPYEDQEPVVVVVGSNWDTYREGGGKQGKRGTVEEGKESKDYTDPPQYLQKYQLILWFEEYSLQINRFSLYFSPLQFIDELKNSHQVSEVNILNLAKELLVIETSNFEIRKTLKDRDLIALFVIPRYESYILRLQNCISERKGPIPNEEKYVFSILLTTANNQLTTFKYALGIYFIHNLTGYIKTFYERFEEYADEKKTLDRKEYVKAIKNEYQESFDSKIREGQEIIRNSIEPLIVKIKKEIKVVTREFQGEIDQLIDESLQEEKAYDDAVKEVQNRKGLRIFLGALQIGATALALFGGPVGGAIGAAVGVTATITEKLALPDTTPTDPTPVKPSVHTNYLSEFQDLLEVLDDDIENSKIIMSEADEFLKNDKGPEKNAKKKQISQSLQALKAKMNRWDQLGSLGTETLEKNKINIEIEKEKDNLVSGLKNYKTFIEDARQGKVGTDEEKEFAKKYGDKQIKGIGGVVALAEIASTGLNVAKGFVTDADKEKQLKKLATAAADKSKALYNFQEEVSHIGTFLSESVIDAVIKTSQSAHDQSTIILQYKEWDIGNKMRRFSNLILGISREFPNINRKYERLVGDLNAGITAVLEMYKTIEHFKEKKKDGEYLANLVTSGAKTAYDGIDQNPEQAELFRLCEKINIALDGSLLFQEFEQVVQAFRQWIFPFPYQYNNDNDPFHNNYLDRANASEMVKFMVPLIKKRAESIKKTVEDSKTAFNKLSSSISQGDFYSDTNLGPFFKWTWEANEVKINRLFLGKVAQFTSTPELMYAKGRAAVKFSEIGIKITARNAKHRVKLDSILQRTRIYMNHSGISHYMYQDKTYVMEDKPLEIWYSVEKDQKNEPTDSNDIYRGLKKGDFLLSPYTTWSIQLEPYPGFESQFSNLNYYSDLVDIDLVGRGWKVEFKPSRSGKTLQRKKQSTKKSASTPLFHYRFQRGGVPPFDKRSTIGKILNSI